SRILQREPDWTLLPANVGRRIRELLRLCLEKDVRKRRSDAADVRIDIEQALSEPPESAKLPAPTPTHLRLAWIVAVVSLIAIAALAVPTVRHLREAAPPEIRVEVNMPPTADPFSFAISPDGRRLVFVASMESKSQLWVQPLDSPTAQPLAGTDGAAYPFGSPDGASGGFFADGKLKRIDSVGGAPNILANAPFARGGSFNREGTVLFAPRADGPLWKLPATGGEPAAVTRLNGESGHKFPQ